MSVLDFRGYRPAAVLVLDLVKHSTKPRESAARARRAVESIFARQLQALALRPEDVSFNYTGDGYVCALLGDASSRVIDFINRVVPELLRELGAVDQEFRAGLDIGLVHLSPNALTGGLEHFDVPGIVAARLEQVAQPNEVLGTDAVKHIFGPLYPDVFGGESRVVRSKDRELLSHPIIPVDYDAIRRLLRVSLFPGRDEPLSAAERGTLLIVDDDDMILLGLESILSDAYVNVTTAPTGQSATEILNERAFTVALLDICLPDTTGIEIARHIARKHPSTIVIMMTGAGSFERVHDSYSAGASFFLEKPFGPEELFLVMDRCIRRRAPATLRAELQLLCDNVSSVILKMQHVSDAYYRVVRHDEADAATSLLRHKARGLADEFVARLQPGTALEELLDALLVQLGSLNRLGELVRRARPADLIRYLESLATDFATLYPKVKIAVDGSAGDTTRVPHATLYTLAICELIDNAVVAVRDGGCVNVTLSELTASGILHTRVRDDGPGVSESIRDRLFTPGVSTKGIGRGLGLSLVRDAVTRIGGSVSYEYERGSVFTLTAPLAP